MNAFVRGLALVAIVSQIAVGATDAYARGQGSAAGNGGASSGNGGGNAGASSGGVGGGHGGGFNAPPRFNNPPPFAAFTALAGAPGASGACGVDLQLPDTSWYTHALDGVEVISQQTQNYMAFCGCATQACVADALDKYADALEQALAPPPPAPGMAAPRARPRAVRDLPRIVREAAAKVRAAKTRPAAEKAVQAAVETVRAVAAKTIAMMRAADPDAKQIVTRSADLVADTLTVAKTTLERADAL